MRKGGMKKHPQGERLAGVLLGLLFGYWFNGYFGNTTTIVCLECNTSVVVLAYIRACNFLNS